MAKLFRSVVKTNQAAFTLIEVLIVIAIIAGAYSIALPNLSRQTETDVANSLSRLTQDIKAAFDTAVLTGKSYRFVFELQSGKYWLERTESDLVYMGDQKVRADPTPEELEEKKQEFEEQFEKYTELAGEAFKDPDTDEEIQPVSPVLMAKKRLSPPEWEKIDNPEWRMRALTDVLIFREIQAEHHEEPVSVEAMGDEARAFVYILSSGYIEKTVMYIYYRLNDADFDTDRKPYTVIIRPHLGQATIVDGRKEIDFEEEDDEEDT